MKTETARTRDLVRAITAYFAATTAAGFARTMHDPFRAGFTDILVLGRGRWIVIEAKNAETVEAAWKKCTAIQKRTLGLLSRVGLTYVIAYHKDGTMSFGMVHARPGASVVCEPCERLDLNGAARAICFDAA
jgi:hypothetical protein